MSIQPIDLQTLFMKLSQVGRDQAVEKDKIALQQTLQGNEIAKRNQDSDKIVNKADNLDSGPEKTKDEGESGIGAQSQEKRKNEQSKTAEDKEILSDPALGKNIDFSG
ncbi:MAG: hypothetical protein FWC36_10450 [Spirochaetes bacterium]|nr:hypothetical protein [Spirochaetota bacterium]